jgi:hypothetical protein
LLSCIKFIFGVTMRIGLFVSAMLAFSSAANASVVVLDFENLGFDPVSTFDTEGFTFSGGPWYLSVPANTNTVGISPTGSYAMARTDGGAFSLLSWELGAASLDDEIHVTGYLAGGGQVNTTFITSDFQTLNFSSEWQNLLSVEFDPTVDMVFDNIAASVVPIPAAVWLFGSALAGLGWLRRKQTV